MAIFWVVSAKREETRARRLATLIDDSAGGRRIALLRAPERRRAAPARPRRPSSGSG
jgi:hypothetical protein